MLKSFFELKSPINEILDGEECTLESLLKEEELLVELKSRNPKLIHLYTTLQHIYHTYIP